MPKFENPCIWGDSTYLADNKVIRVSHVKIEGKQVFTVMYMPNFIQMWDRVGLNMKDRMLSI